MPEVLYDPEEITRRSYEYIDRNLEKEFKNEGRRKVARRIVHTSGDFSLVESIRFRKSPISKSIELLPETPPVVSDVSMVKAGLRSRLLEECGLETYSYVHRDEANEIADQESITRSAAGLELALRDHDSFILLVGNAPTVIHRLLDRSISSKRVPLVVGAPVGFIGVEEAKERLLNSEHRSIVIEGTRGGSPLAATIMNALMMNHLGESNVR